MSEFLSEHLLSCRKLALEQREGSDFAVVAVLRPSPCAILAPHGGGIGPGTPELARAIAGATHIRVVRTNP